MDFFKMLSKLLVLFVFSAAAVYAQEQPETECQSCPIVRKPIPDKIYDENQQDAFIDLSSVFFDRDMESAEEQLTYCIYENQEDVSSCPPTFENEVLALKFVASMLKISFKKDQYLEANGVGFTVAVVDSSKNRATSSFNIKVKNRNNPPQIKQGKSLTFDFNKEETLIVNLADYFEDKDVGESNTLTFASKIEENAKALLTTKTDLTGSTLILHSSGSVGKGVITVAAKDNSGAANDTITVPLTVGKEKEVSSFSKYPECIPFCFEFVAGYEGTTIDDVNNHGNSRIEFISQLWIKAANKEHEWHVSGNILQTSVGVKKTDDESSEPPEEGMDASEDKAEIDTAIEANFTAGYFFENWALGVNSPLDGHRPGIIATFGGVKPDDGDFQHKYYVGLRTEHSHLQYIDILYGKTEGIKGNRVEFRGQLPISDKFLTGFVINVGVSDRQENTDTIRFYISIPTSALGLFD